MRIAITVLIGSLLIPQLIGKELFSARSVPALTQNQFTWQIDEIRDGLKIMFSDPKKKFQSQIRGRDAESLLARIRGMTISQADVEILHSLEVATPDGKILLHPFDGVTYFVSIMQRKAVTIPNPSFDLEHHPTLVQTKRIREVLDFLDELMHIAKK